MAFNSFISVYNNNLQIIPIDMFLKIKFNGQIYLIG